MKERWPLNILCGNLLESAACQDSLPFLQLRAGHAVIFSLEIPQLRNCVLIFRRPASLAILLAVLRRVKRLSKDCHHCKYIPRGVLYFLADTGPLGTMNVRLWLSLYFYTCKDEYTCKR